MADPPEKSDETHGASAPSPAPETPPAADPTGPTPSTAPAADPPSSDDDDLELEGLSTDELKALARKMNRELKRVQRKMKAAGISRDDERRLADEVARLSAELADVKAAIVTPETPPADASTNGSKPPAAAGDDDWSPTIL